MKFQSSERWAIQALALSKKFDTKSTTTFQSENVNIKFAWKSLFNSVGNISKGKHFKSPRECVPAMLVLERWYEINKQTHKHIGRQARDQVKQTKAAENRQRCDALMQASRRPFLFTNTWDCNLQCARWWRSQQWYHLKECSTWRKVHQMTSVGIY